jgi:hypothetical protein
VVEVGAGRALASKYPAFIEIAEAVLQSWKHRRLSEVLVALQMTGAMSHSDTISEGRVVELLDKLRPDIGGIEVRDFNAYRLLHHFFETFAEVTGDQGWAHKAIDLSARYPDYELLHLQLYGWGVGLM